jgi:hypothetical protein
VKSVTKQTTMEGDKSTEARGSLPAGDGGPGGGEPVTGGKKNPVLGTIYAILRGQPGRTEKGGQE